MRLKNTLVTLAVVGLAGYGALKLYVFYQAKENFQKILHCAGLPGLPSGAPPRDIIDYDRITASVFGPIGIKGLKLRFPQLDEEIYFDEVLLTYDYDGDLSTCPTPRHINFSINDMRMNVSLLEKIEKQRAMVRQRSGLPADSDVPELVKRFGYGEQYIQSRDLRALGYDKLVANVSFDLVFDPGNKQATFNMHEKIKDMGDFMFMFTVADMAKNINSAVLGVKIKEARIEYTDESYIQRLYKMFATRNNENIDTYRKKVIASMETQISDNRIKLGKESQDNLKSFITDPKRLIITMYPYEPVGIQSIKLYKPGDVPLLLNLQIYTH